MANGYRIEYFVSIAPLVWWPAILWQSLYIQGVCKDYNIIKVSLVIYSFWCLVTCVQYSVNRFKHQNK